MAGCDEIGLGAWKALNDRNLSVPRDVSLVGFDDEDFPEGLEIPADMPPEIAAMLIEETRQAVRNGESLDEFLARVTGGPPGGKRKEGRRK